MPGFDGTGPNGMGSMTGGGRGYCNPWGAGVRNYAFPRWAPHPYPRYGVYGFNPFIPGTSREQEFASLREQAKALKNELNQLETEIGKLSTENK